jgi:6-phosphogluconolactonase (cycloisomerase 2 family)
MSKKIIGSLACLGLLFLLLSCGSSSSRPAGELYVLSQGNNNVGYFAIDLSNGRLSLINKHSDAGMTPSSILLDPNGSVAYVLNTGANSITSYTIGNDGTLSAPTLTSLPVQNSIAMARDAVGTFLIVVSQGTVATRGCQQSNLGCGEPPAITVFATTAGSATLTPVGSRILNFVPTSVTTSVTGTFNDPNFVPPAPPTVDGTLVQITGNQDLSGLNNDNTISEFVVQASGAVAGPLIGSPYTTQSSPSAVLAVKTAPTGGAGGVFVYVTNVTTNNVDIYELCTVPDSANCLDASDDIKNGKLVHVPGSVSVGLDPVAMTVDPTNNFLYVVNHTSSTVSSFRINPTTGVLSALNPATVSTGSSPVAISMHSSGKFLFVSNNASSNISAFNVSTTNGALSNATNVTSDAQPAGLAAR